MPMPTISGTCEYYLYGRMAYNSKLKILRWGKLSWIIQVGPMKSQGSLLGSRGRFDYREDDVTKAEKEWMMLRSWL